MRKVLWLVQRLREKPWDELAIRDAVLHMRSWSSAKKLVVLALVMHRGRDGTSRVGARALAGLAGVHTETVTTTLAMLADSAFVRVSRPGQRNAPSIVDLRGLPIHLANSLEADSCQETCSGCEGPAVSGSEIHAVSGSEIHAVSGSEIHAVSGSEIHGAHRSAPASGSEIHGAHRSAPPSGSEIHAVSGSDAPRVRIGTHPVSGSEIRKGSEKEIIKESDLTRAHAHTREPRQSTRVLEKAKDIEERLAKIPPGGATEPTPKREPLVPSDGPQPTSTSPTSYLSRNHPQVLGAVQAKAGAA